MHEAVTLKTSVHALLISALSALCLIRPEFLDVASRLNGSDFNGDSKPDYALCMQTSDACLDEVFSLGMIFTGLTQTSVRVQFVLAC